MCDMCSSPESVYRIELEGTKLNVCEKCASYGKVLGRIRQEEPETPKVGKLKRRPVKKNLCSNCQKEIYPEQQ